MRVATVLTALFAAFACGDAFLSTPTACVGSKSVAGALPKSSSLREYLLFDPYILFPFHLHKSTHPNVYFRTQSYVLLSDMSAFDGIKEPVQSYVDIWTPMFKQASESGLVPDFLLHWGHGAAMASVLLSMGEIGAYSEWKSSFLLSTFTSCILYTHL